VFDLLADSQTYAMARNTTAMAQRDFWLAHTDLQALLAGAPIDAIGGDASNTPTEARAASGAGGH
jgi:hypothetical protein